MTLHLTATTIEEKALKEYLEQTVSEELAEKINNGVPVEKDGKKLISKKTLAGFMEYATKEAQKQAIAEMKDPERLAYWQKLFEEQLKKKKKGEKQYIKLQCYIAAQLLLKLKAEHADICWQLTKKTVSD